MSYVPKSLQTRGTLEHALLPVHSPTPKGSVPVPALAPKDPASALWLVFLVTAIWRLNVLTLTPKPRPPPLQTCCEISV